MNELSIAESPSLITGATSWPEQDISVQISDCRPGEIEQFVSHWRNLCDESDADIFYRPEWTQAYLNSFAPQAKLTLVTTWSKGRLRGILPLMREPVRAFGLQATRLSQPGNVHCFRTGPAICAGDEGQRVLRAIWNALNTLPGWDLLDVSQVLGGSGMDLLAGIAASENFPVARKRTSQTLYLPIPAPSNGQPWTPEIRPKFRSHLRRARRQLEELGKLELKHYSTADPAALQRFYDLEGSGWKGAEGTAIKCHASTRHFYDDVAQAAARHGYLSMDFLQLSGKPIAAHLGFNFRGHYYLAKAGYDEEYRRFGPGQLLVNEILAQAAERGLHKFDFVGPATWDESRWTSVRHTNYRVFIFRKGWYGRLLHMLRISGRDTLLRLIGRDDDESKPLELKSKPQGRDKESGTES